MCELATEGLGHYEGSGASENYVATGRSGVAVGLDGDARKRDQRQP